MAKATKTENTITRIVRTYTLTLSQAEADTLLTILQKVGGSPDHSRRKYARQVLEALESWNLGVQYDMSDISDRGTGIYFDELEDMQ